MMQKYYISVFFIILSFGFSNSSHAGDSKYPFADIPKPLLKDAKAVVRNQEVLTDITSNGRLVQKVKYAITILNKNGEQNSFFLHPYDKTIKVSNIKAHAYDETGQEIDKKGGFEVLDYAMIGQGTTYADSRIKVIIPEQFTYPFTIEYSYEVTYSGVFIYPGWHPVTDFNVAVEKSKFILNVSKQSICRYHEKNFTSKVRIESTDKSTIYTWDLTNLPAYKKEKFCPAISDFTPGVMLAPSQIKVEEYEGNIETWEGFGQWINKLNYDRNNLSLETKAKILKMTEGISDERVKIKLLYEYMQNKTRYVSIQIGLGGFQPFDAEIVDRLSYGDCKALSNYMKTILEVAGISSRYTLVYAGRENPTINCDFPSSQFNHAILCVPLARDTIWLECTSQSIPFNYLGTFTSDRKVLVMDSTGGKFMHTPALRVEDNLESRNVKVQLNQSGGGIIEAHSCFSGATYDSYMPILMSDQTDRKKMLTEKIQVPNFELVNFNIHETKSEHPFVTEHLNLTITNYCTKIGDKLMLCLNIMNKLKDSPFQASTRKNIVSIKWPIHEVDTVSYLLPDGYTLDKIPEKINILCDFGQYTAEVTKSGSTIQYVRTFKVLKADHAVESYNDIVIFFDKIVKADENKILLTKVM